MTNSRDPMIGKRERLVRSAMDLMYVRGVERPTLADIAKAADVPLGNVYYYFKTRDEIVEAVVDARAYGVRQLLANAGQLATPRARLKALARFWVDYRNEMASHGCPIGTLCSALNKQDAAAGRRAAAIFAETASWIAEQFRQLGRRDSRELAITMLSTVQGAALLSNAFHDPLIMATQIRRLEGWIDSVAKDATVPPAKGREKR